MDMKTSSRSRLAITVAIIVILAAIIGGIIWMLNTPRNPYTITPMPTAPKTDESNKDSNRPAITAQKVSIAYITIGDEGKTGEMIGCGDSVVIVNKTVQATSSVEGALQTLLSDKSEHYGQSGLYNSLWQSALTLDAVNVVGATANVTLSGQMQLSGECDNPRVKAQLESTVKQSSNATTVNVTINGKTLDEALSLK